MCDEPKSEMYGIVIAPISWRLFGFPLPDRQTEVVSMDFVIEALNSFADKSVEEDTTPLYRALHPAHLLKTLQGRDGAWPKYVNARTGEAVNDGTSEATAPLSGGTSEATATLGDGTSEGVSGDMSEVPAPLGGGRTFAPVPLFRRLNEMLGSSEFAGAVEAAERNGFIG